MKRGMLRSSNGAYALLGLAALLAVLGIAATAQSAVLADYPDFTDVSDLSLNGDAHQSGNILRLTDSAPSRTGTAFTKKKVLNHKKSFESELSFEMHSTGGNPGDGMAFFIHSKGKSAVGDAGGGLGYASIADSVAVEFDTFDNGGSDEQANEVAIIVNGKAGKSKDASVPGFQLYGGQRYAWVSYKAKSGKLNVFVSDTSTKPSSPMVSAKVKLQKVLEGKARAGFTAASGGATETHDVLSWTLTQ